MIIIIISNVIISSSLGRCPDKFPSWRNGSRCHSEFKFQIVQFAHYVWCSTCKYSCFSQNIYWVLAWCHFQLLFQPGSDSYFDPNNYWYNKEIYIPNFLKFCVRVFIFEFIFSLPLYHTSIPCNIIAVTVVFIIIIPHVCLKLFYSYTCIF
jgi:hypothetical protein